MQEEVSRVFEPIVQPSNRIVNEKAHLKRMVNELPKFEENTFHSRKIEELSTKEEETYEKALKEPSTKIKKKKFFIQHRGKKEQLDLENVAEILKLLPWKNIYLRIPLKNEPLSSKQADINYELWEKTLSQNEENVQIEKILLKKRDMKKCPKMIITFKRWKKRKRMRQLLKLMK